MFEEEEKLIDDATKLANLIGACEEVLHGAIKIDGQDSRITNYSLRLLKEALSKMLNV